MWLYLKRILATLCYNRRYTFLYVFHNPFVLSPLADMIVVFFIFHYIIPSHFIMIYMLEKKGKHKKIQLFPQLVFCRAKLQNFLLKYAPFPQNFPMKKIEKTQPTYKIKEAFKKNWEGCSSQFSPLYFPNFLA